jgi:hypothetical protein
MGDKLHGDMFVNGVVWAIVWQMVGNRLGGQDDCQSLSCQSLSGSIGKEALSRPRCWEGHLALGQSLLRGPGA